jgi:beta-glucosidase
VCFAAFLNGTGAVLYAFASTITARTVEAQQPPTSTSNAPWRNANLPVDVRVRELLSRMTLEQKFWQLFMIPGSLDNPAHDYSNGVFGLQISADTTIPPTQAARAHAERVNSIQRYFVERTPLGIPIIPFDEALHGLMREGAITFPHAIAMAATWDSALISRASEASARETRSRGIRQALSPVVNIASDVRWGRVEETYGEDPYLTGVMGRVFVRAFEQAGIVTTPKHFVANVGEGGRDSYPAEFSQRVLEERFFPPFQSLIAQAGARSVMTAYNSVDGLPATQNGPLLNGTLRREWGFTGFVISDAAATGGATVLHHTEASTATATKRAFEAGLDVVFQSEYPQHRPYLEAFRRGMVSDAVMNAAVSRVLRVKFELGLFEQPFVDPDSAAYWSGHATHRALAREVARKSMVLLRNKSSTLPLARTTRRIAVIGTDAVEGRSGGYSGPGIRTTNMLDGIRTAAGANATVHFAPGPGRFAATHMVVPAENLSALRGEYFTNIALTGTPFLVRDDARIDFGWTLNSPARGIAFDWYSVRWTGTITAPADGVTQIGVEGNDGYRLWIDDSLVVDNWEKRSHGAHMANVQFAPGSKHTMRLEFFESAGNARVKLVWNAGVRSAAALQQTIDSAAHIARNADVAVVAVGTEEGEFRDRAMLALPGKQEALIREVAATGTPVVVVLVGGSAITMSPWLESVGAVLHAWYPGEEGGHALADVLFGAESPAGRLPITFPVSEGQLPLSYNHKPTGRGDDYVDLTGQPLFPFGYGLSYTTFEYSALRITPDSMSANETATVTATITNTGARAGDEVVQLYIRDVLATMARPVIQLAGFTRIHLAPGEKRDVTFTLTREQLQMLDVDMQWVVEPGVFRVLVGASSKDIRLRGELVVR